MKMLSLEAWHVSYWWTDKFWKNCEKRWKKFYSLIHKQRELAETLMLWISWFQDTICQSAWGSLHLFHPHTNIPVACCLIHAPWSRHACELSRIKWTTTRRRPCSHAVNGLNRRWVVSGTARPRTIPEYSPSTCS